MVAAVMVMVVAALAGHGVQAGAQVGRDAQVRPLPVS